MEGIGLTCGRKVKNLTFPPDSVPSLEQYSPNHLLYMDLLLCDKSEVFITSSIRLLTTLSKRKKRSWRVWEIL